MDLLRQFVPQEACLKCKGCCRFKRRDSVWLPTLLEEEAADFGKLGLPPALIAIDKKIRVASFPKEKTFICSLFNPEENKCKIYQHRPFECRLYPFVLTRREDTACLALDPNCPFAASHRETKEFKEFTAYLKDFLQGPQQKAVLKNNPQIIQDYPEAQELCRL